MEPGQVVKLRSGGPKMTITKTRDARSETTGSKGCRARIWCIWFGHDGKVHRGDFSPIVLEKVAESHVDQGRKRAIKSLAGDMFG